MPLDVVLHRGLERRSPPCPSSRARRARARASVRRRTGRRAPSRRRARSGRRRTGASARASSARRRRGPPLEQRGSASATISAERSARNTPGESIGSTKPNASPTITQPGPRRRAARSADSWRTSRPAVTRVPSPAIARQPGVGRDRASSRSSGRAPEARGVRRPSTMPIDSRSLSGMHQIQPASPRPMSTCPGASSQRKPSKWAKCATSLRGPRSASMPSTRAACRARPVASTMRSGWRPPSDGAAASVSGASTSSRLAAPRAPAPARARATHARDAAATAHGGEGLVEVRARDVVGVGEHAGREAREREAEAVGRRPDERHARLHAAEARPSPPRCRGAEGSGSPRARATRPRGARGAGRRRTA